MSLIHDALQQAEQDKNQYVVGIEAPLLKPVQLSPEQLTPREVGPSETALIETGPGGDQSMRPRALAGGKVGRWLARLMIGSLVTGLVLVAVTLHYFRKVERSLADAREARRPPAPTAAASPRPTPAGGSAQLAQANPAPPAVSRDTATASAAAETPAAPMSPAELPVWLATASGLDVNEAFAEAWRFVRRAHPPAGAVEPADDGPGDEAEAGQRSRAVDAPGRGRGRAPASDGRAEAAEKTRRARTAAAYRLTGVMSGTFGPKAVINRSIVVVGDMIDEAEVIAIGERSITLEKDGEQFEVRIKED